MTHFRFEPRWREELVCTSPEGHFILELSMGVLTAYLPTEEVWRQRGPTWARDLWPVLHRELLQWCASHRADCVVSPAAQIW